MSFLSMGSPLAFSTQQSSNRKARLATITSFHIFASPLAAPRRCAPLVGGTPAGRRTVRGGLAHARVRVLCSWHWEEHRKGRHFFMGRKG
jgi:hypothetical protein